MNSTVATYSTSNFLHDTLRPSPNDIGARHVQDWKRYLRYLPKDIGARHVKDWKRHLRRLEEVRASAKRRGNPRYYDRNNLPSDIVQSALRYANEQKFRKRVRRKSNPLIDGFKNTNAFDTRHWRSICDVTFTLKQARRADLGGWAIPPLIKLDLIQCEKAFHHFLNLLNRAAYGNAFRRGYKKLLVIPIIEKDAKGRWHIHAAIEPPTHIRPFKFRPLIEDCWKQVHWSYSRMLVRVYADNGWISNYTLKPYQKSGLEAWSDCIAWSCFNNPIADA